MASEAEIILRIERLDLTNRRLMLDLVSLRRAKRMQVFVLVVVLAACLASASSTQAQEVLTVRELRVVSGGETRAVLGETAEGFSLRFFNRGETKVLEIGALGGFGQDPVPGLKAFDPKGVPQVRLSVEAGEQGAYGLLEFSDVLHLRGGREIPTQIFLRDTRPAGVFGKDTGYGTNRGAMFDFSGRSDVTIDAGRELDRDG